MMFFNLEKTEQDSKDLYSSIINSITFLGPPKQHTVDQTKQEEPELGEKKAPENHK